MGRALSDTAMILRFLAALALIACAGPARAADRTPSNAEAAFEQWRAAFRQSAIDSGLARSAVDTILDGTTYRQDVIHEDRFQYEAIAPLDKFFGDVTAGTTISDGRRAYARNRAIFASVAERYGVDAYPILGIWANESRYGKLIRPFPIASSLATLAYDKRRSGYFSNELKSFIRMQELGVPRLPQMTGSWAGALGQPQFEPSDYLQYAVDFDGDGKRDIWNDEADVIGSVANFLHRNGWQLGLPWGAQVTPSPALASDESLKRAPGANCKASDTLSRRLSIGEWRELGLAGIDPAWPKSMQASLLIDRHLSGRAFLVTHNFEVILRYNCSLQYALTAGLTSDLVLKGQATISGN
jgi:peptidoglycan lytic transglycosylase B